MEYQEVKYIINYFPRLRTPLERKTLNYNRIVSKLGKVEDYSNIKKFEQKKKFFENRLRYKSNNKEVTELLKDGYEIFILKTGKRIKENHADEYIIYTKHPRNP